MDDDKKISPAPVQPASVTREIERARGEVSNFIESSEPSPEISPEVRDYIQPSEQSIPHKDIIKASGENIPVPTAPTGIVQIPEIPKRKQAEIDLKLGPREGKAWEATEIIREDDKIQMEILKSKLQELKEKAA